MRAPDSRDWVELELARVSAESASWRHGCKARDADSGLQCGLLEHLTGDHRSARGPFRQTLNGGATAGRVAELLHRATSNPGGV